MKNILTLAISVFTCTLILNACNENDCTKLTWYRDNDEDGYGNPDVLKLACDQPTGYVLDHTDFNDESDAAYPGANEICNDHIDNDNDGTTDCEYCPNGGGNCSVCLDGMDNDLDGSIDAQDPGCK